MDNKHYIRVDENNLIIKSFSDAFEQPTESDIFIEEGGRHYNLDLLSEDIWKYKYDNGIRECTQVEVDLYKSTIPIPPPTMEYRLQAQAEAIMTLMEVIGSV